MNEWENNKKTEQSGFSNNQTIREKILNEAIKAGGTTIRSYTSSLGVTGLFQMSLHAYGKKDKKCERCGSQIIKTVVATRGTYYCPNCQKLNS